MKAWLFQDRKQLAKLGAADCPWSVGYYSPDGRRKQKTVGARSLAEKERQKVAGQLVTGTYQDVSRASWEAFKVEYESKVLAGMEPGTRDVMQRAMNHFDRIAKPEKMRGIVTKAIAGYIATRRAEKHNGKAISPATVNVELRCLRAVLRKAHKWGYLATVPDFDFQREPGRIPTYVTPEHFTALYQACDAADEPTAQGYVAGDWWRALLTTAYMTGWRIGSLLSLAWQDVDLEKGMALSRAEHNKGRRDQLIPLHPIVVEHLARLRSFRPNVFAHDHDRRGLYKEFAKVQTAAKVKPTGKPRYGFHDFRRAFATMNADKLTGDALQALMQHRDYQTTQKYINLARQLNPAVASLYVPPMARAAQ